ncbi:MAG: hypothetical protein GY927_12960 [bacterium]|nr:hypothetical protein [bacterium]
MPRKPRFYIPDVPAHIVQRGRSREPVFFEDDDYRAYIVPGRKKRNICKIIEIEALSGAKFEEKLQYNIA